jgi:hypothetical protein
MGPLMRTDNDSTLIMRRRLEELAVFEYRSVVVARLGVTAEWRGLDWTNRAACAGHPTATARLCGRCPVAAECLAAAVTTDDPSSWRGFLSRADREHLWAALERTYRDLQDLEVMRMDTGRLPRRPVLHRVVDLERGRRS